MIRRRCMNDHQTIQICSMASTEMGPSGGVAWYYSSNMEARKKLRIAKLVLNDSWNQNRQGCAGSELASTKRETNVFPPR